MCGPTTTPPPRGQFLTSDTNKAPQDRATSELSLATRIQTLTMDALLTIYTLGFSAFRVGELVPLFAIYPQWCATALATLISGVVLILPIGYGVRFDGGGGGGVDSSPSLLLKPIRLRHVLTVVTLAFIVYAVDHILPHAPPAAVDGGSAVRTVVITGANSGIGFETARSLVVDRGLTVIMGCRSMDRCQAAADQINGGIETSPRTGNGIIEGGRGRAIPLPLDLSDFKSVQTFATKLLPRELKQSGVGQIDVLFNNAGYAPPPNQPVNSMGYDPSFTSMHLSHHLLTELLVKSNNPKLRVVNTSSGTHHLCALPFAYLPSKLLEWGPIARRVPHGAGCVDEDYLSDGIQSPTDSSSYVRSKVANVLHVTELARRHEGVTAIAIDLGWVGTSIQPFMEYVTSPANLGWMRKADVGILPVLNGIFMPAEELGRGAGGEEYRRGVVMNVFGMVEEPFSYTWWTDNTWSGRSVGRDRMDELGRKLWVETTAILRRNGQRVR